MCYTPHESCHIVDILPLLNVPAVDPGIHARSDHQHVVGGREADIGG